MNRTLLVLSLAAAASPCLADAPLPGHPPGDPQSAIKAAFGNTIISTYPDGRTAELWLQPGGDYTAEGRRHDRSSGHWKLKGEKLCLKQSHPIPVPFTFCTPVAAARMGASWAGKAVSGEPIRIKLVRGKVDPAAGDPVQGDSSSASRRHPRRDTSS